MNVLAEIASDERDWSDIFLLIAVIVFAVAAVFDVRSGTLTRSGAGSSSTLVALGLACTALALMLL